MSDESLALIFLLCLDSVYFPRLSCKQFSLRESVTLAGLSYPCLLCGVIMAISVSGIWLETLALACLSTWVCDTAAQLGGRSFGRHKLKEQVSPNKTIEGAVFGAVSSLLVGVLAYYLGICCMNAPYVGDLYTPLLLWLCVATCLAASTMGQIGDLAVCFVKLHSSIDVLSALPVCLIAELAVYGKDYWKPRYKLILIKTKIKFT